MLGHPANAEHMIIRGIAPKSLEEDHRHALDLNRAISEPMDMGDDILRIEIDGEAEVIVLKPMVVDASPAMHRLAQDEGRGRMRLAAFLS
jgi:hypothetical protein